VAVAKFLFTVWQFAGHIHPSLAVANALRARGHEVAFYTGGQACRAVQQEGFRCFPFRRVDEARVEQIVSSPTGLLSHPRNPFRTKAMWRAWVLDTVPAQLADLEVVLASWLPDVIVCDPSMWGPFLILHEARRISVAIFSLVAICLLSGREGPIPGFPLPRPRTWYQRWRAQALRVITDLFLADIRRAANALRRSYRLPPLRSSVTDYAGQMPLYLVPSSSEFDYRRTDLPPSVHYVGPCWWHKSDDLPAPEWLTKLPNDQPLVYVTEGTVNLQPRILKAAAQGLAYLPIQVVMTTGRHRDPATLDLGPRPLAPNIHVERWVPLADLLPRMSVLVTTGGPSTLMAALSRGVPVVIVPSDWDHPETGWRLVETGAGVRLTPKACTPQRLREAVELVLHEPSFHQNAQRLAASLARCGGPARAAELLERLTVRPEVSSAQEQFERVRAEVS
jgi:MGT family glycosyltransferase